MTEYLIEQLVKKQMTAKDNFKKTGLFALVVLSGLLIPFTQFAFLIMIVLIVIAVILIRRMNVEYEYIYFNGDLDIDKIMNRETRKRAISTRVKEMDIIAPKGDQAVLGYQHLKVLDFTTCSQDGKVYEMVTLVKGEKTRVLFEPNEKILNAIRDIAPRKVVF